MEAIFKRHRHKRLFLCFDRQNAIHFMVVLLGQAIKHDAIFVTLQKCLLSIVLAMCACIVKCEKLEHLWTKMQSLNCPEFDGFYAVWLCFLCCLTFFMYFSAAFFVPILYLRALFIGLCKFHVNQFYAFFVYFLCTVGFHANFTFTSFRVFWWFGSCSYALQQWNFERKSNMRKIYKKLLVGSCFFFRKSIN